MRSLCTEIYPDVEREKLREAIKYYKSEYVGYDETSIKFYVMWSEGGNLDISPFVFPGMLNVFFFVKRNKNKGNLRVTVNHFWKKEGE